MISQVRGNATGQVLAPPSEIHRSKSILEEKKLNVLIWQFFFDQPE